jgi:5'-3' exonuclease
MPTLLLVDGSSYLYRAFHALPDLRNLGRRADRRDPRRAVHAARARIRL